MRDGPGEPRSYVFLGAARSARRHPAVTLEVAKRPGVNATALVRDFLTRRVTELKSTLLSRDVQVARPRGTTARRRSTSPTT